MTFLDLFEVQEAATKLIRIMDDLSLVHSLGERKGGYLTLVGIDGLPLDTIVLPVGEVPSPEEGCAYMSNSLEKAERLRKHFKRDHTAISSWQTRNEDERMYGGAVIATPRGGIVSFSGLPEHYDEALCVGVTYELELENEIRTNRIADVSNNEVLRLLSDHGFE